MHCVRGCFPVKKLSLVCWNVAFSCKMLCQSQTHVVLGLLEFAFSCINVVSELVGGLLIFCCTCVFVHEVLQWNPSIVWTHWGPGKVSCIGRCPHFRGKFTLRKHIWDTSKCP